MNNLFLHFLNRELLRSIGKGVPKEMFQNELKILALTTTANLFTNYANTIEGNYLGSAVFRELVVSNIIYFYSERPSFQEYIESSRSRYSFDKARYPYFSEEIESSDALTPYMVRDFSMTTKLKSGLFAYSNEGKDKYNLVLSNEMSTPFNKLAMDLSTHSGDEALTMSLANTKINTTNQSKGNRELLGSMGRLLALLYVKEYKESLDADISTGISGLTYFDKLSDSIPKYDVPLRNWCLISSGFDLNSLSVADLITFRNTSLHTIVEIQINNIILTLWELFKKSTTEPRLKIIQALSRNRLELPTQLHELPLKLELLKNKVAQSIPDFLEHYEKQENRFMNTLIITATTKETRAFFEVMEYNLKTKPIPEIRGQSVISYMGVMNKTNVYHVQCEAGSTGPSGAQAVATDAIQALKPQYIILGGICFGLNSSKQNYGDVLIATHISTYEKERHGEIVISRADKPSVSPLLLSVFRTVSSTWDKAQMSFGIMMSGEKLVDDEEFVQKLKKIEPESIGGEMEGAGLYSAAYRNHKDWIVVKSIVDFGTGKTDEFHESSSKTVFEAIYEALRILSKN